MDNEIIEIPNILSEKLLNIMNQIKILEGNAQLIVESFLVGKGIIIGNYQISSDAKSLIKLTMNKENNKNE